MTFARHNITLLFIILSLSSFGQSYVIPDAGFKQCLIDNYPAVLDINDDLDIAAANAMTGDLYCPGFGIENLDGVQHFTSVDTLYLHQNNLQDIDEVGSLSTLKVLITHSNELSHLPDLTTFSELTIVEAYDNFITAVPPLPTSSQLISLDMRQNNLTSLPDFSNHTNLHSLKFSRNRGIGYIAPLPSLPNLVYFGCYICGLSEVPDVSNLSALEFLNVGYNNIRTLPDFSANTQLITIYANDNLLTSFEDMTVLPNLDKARLYNNQLSFEDFERLLAIPSYSDIYKIIPQNPLPNPVDAHYFEYDEVDLEIGLDQSTTGKTYHWYKDDVLIWEGSEDTLLIDSAKIDDSGAYYFTITHSGFPDLTLSSVTRNTTVESCLNPDAFTIEIIGASCDKAGTIKVIPGNQPQEGLSYILESKLSKRVFESYDGVFPNLNNPEYTLYAKAGDRCVKLVNESILLPTVECEEAFFTPDGDGIDDTFYFPQEGVAKIYNKWGQLIQQLNVPAEWDGQTNSNSMIQPGYYTVEINGEKAFNISVVY